MAQLVISVCSTFQNDLHPPIGVPTLCHISQPRQQRNIAQQCARVMRPRGNFWRCRFRGTFEIISPGCQWTLPPRSSTDQDRHHDYPHCRHIHFAPNFRNFGATIHLNHCPLSTSSLWGKLRDQLGERVVHNCTIFPWMLETCGMINADLHMSQYN